jgi:ribose/xylose/arabinose/galactoside ABC-type transport system permease subunit
LAGPRFRAGAALVQSLSSASSFINQDSSLRLIMLGALTLLAAILFSLARRERRRDVY